MVAAGSPTGQRSRGRGAAVLGSLIFLVVAPGTVAGLIPWWITRWRVQAPLLGWTGRIVGGLLVAAGVSVLLDSFARFALVGRGTPAPIAPTERLVVSGLYRHVRNPMYLAVLSIIFGQALLFGSTTLLWYGAVFSLLVHAFVVLYEEPTLRRRYGAEYDRYCAAVRRWRPSVGGYEA
jgi:protein-S-isoprenylcysteine O-methyltransferase Ste14